MTGPETVKIPWGSFSVRQNGITMAGGTGPYEDIKNEAAHYAAVYRQDGNVQVRVRRLGEREVTRREP